MIQIQIAETGEILEIMQGEKIAFEIQNNFFSFKLSGAFSFPFRLPNSPKNRKALGNVGILARKGIQKQSISVILQVLSINFTKCTLNITSAKINDFIEAEININYADFKDAVGSLNIRDVLTDEFRLPIEDFEYTDFYIYKTVEIPFGTPSMYDPAPNVDNQLKYRLNKNGLQQFEIYYHNEAPSLDDVLADIVQNTNTGSYGGKAFVKDKILYFCPADSGNTDILEIDQNFAKFVDNVLVLNGSTIYEFVDVNEKNYTIATEDGVYYPVIYNTEFWDNKNAAWKNYQNAYNNETGRYFQHSLIEINTAEHPQQQFVITPMISVTTLITSTLHKAGYTHTGILKQDDELQTLILYSNTESVYATIAHTPNISTEKFIEMICEVFCLSCYPDFEAKNLHFEANKNILNNAPIKDWTEKGYLTRENIEKKKKYILRYKQEDNLDNYFKEKTIPLENITETEIIETQASSLKVGSIKSQTLPIQYPALTIANVGQWAEIRQKGNSKSQIGIGDNNTTPIKFLFWRGIIDNVPTATASGDDGEYSLEWDGQKGLYEKWHKDYIKFLQFSKTGKFNFHLDLNDARMIIKRPYSRIRYENLIYLIKSVRITIENTSTPFRIPAEVELVKIPT